ncbi:MAG: GreA/GreB family elongation factor [Myxococcota bacterium]
MSQRYVYTPGGIARLRARIAAARQAYKAVCDDNPAALESGDTSGWHDNFAFEENQRQMHQLARHVRELEQIAAVAEVVPVPRAEPERVVLGTRVVYEVDGEVRAGWIAGWDDGDPDRGRISYNSPVGRALVGAEPGDVRELRVAGTTRRLEVVEVGCLREDECRDA